MGRAITVIILLVFGVLSIVSPKLIWKIKSFWRYEKEEATPLILNVIRGVGVIIVGLMAVGALRSL